MHEKLRNDMILARPDDMEHWEHMEHWDLDTAIARNKKDDLAIASKTQINQK